jgi:hypothetical protein
MKARNLNLQNRSRLMFKDFDGFEKCFLKVL